MPNDYALDVPPPTAGEKESAEQKLDRVLTELAAIRGDIQESKTFIERIMGEVKPVLDTLTNNNMFKMMFGGKK
jgi:hypothetical protein